MMSKGYQPEPSLCKGKPIPPNDDTENYVICNLDRLPDLRHSGDIIALKAKAFDGLCAIKELNKMNIK